MTWFLRRRKAARSSRRGDQSLKSSKVITKASHSRSDAAEDASSRSSIFKNLVKQFKRIVTGPKKESAEDQGEHKELKASVENGLRAESNVSRSGNQHSSFGANSTGLPDASSSSSSSSNPSLFDADLYWGPIPSLNEDLIRVLALRLVSHLYGPSCWVVESKHGSFNHVFIIKFATERKNELDDGFPSPHLLAYDTSMENEIGAPFILMSYLSGQLATHVWSHIDEKVVDAEYERDIRRDNILRSLATYMAKMRGLSFDRTGFIDFRDEDCTNPHVVPEKWARFDPFSDQDSEKPYPKTWEEMPTHTTSQSFFDHLMSMKELSDTADDRARRILLSSILPGIAPSMNHWVDTKEFFSLSHNDLDLQNILCDDDGNVTGIVDWEAVKVRPHSMGWCSYPKWIREDLTAGRPWQFSSRRWHSPVQMAEWRAAYSKALDKAVGRTKGLTMDEVDELPMNSSSASHLIHCLYDGLIEVSSEPNQLRHFCDIVASMLFPNTPINMLYKNLDRYMDIGDAFKLPETDGTQNYLGSWLLERARHIMQWSYPPEYRLAATDDTESCQSDDEERADGSDGEDEAPEQSSDMLRTEDSADNKAEDRLDDSTPTACSSSVDDGLGSDEEQSRESFDVDCSSSHSASSSSSNSVSDKASTMSSTSTNATTINMRIIPRQDFPMPRLSMKHALIRSRSHSNLLAELHIEQDTVGGLLDEALASMQAVHNGSH